MSCYRCGEVLATGEAMVVVAHTGEELAEIAYATGGKLRKRALMALDLIDTFRAAEIRAELEAT